MSDWRSDLHAELAAGRRRKHGRRPYDSFAWKQRRSELKDGAACILCARFGLHVRGEVADHVYPARDAGFEGPLQALCTSCHAVKRRLETRWREGKLATSELDFRISKEAARLRAPIGEDGFAVMPIDT